MMTIRECYNALEGNFEEATQRLRMESLIVRFALKFLDDKSFAELEDALSKDDTETAFRAAHTLKGVCANLAFTRLYNSSHDITELLRSSKLDEAKAFFPNVKTDYDVTVNALNAFKSEH